MPLSAAQTQEALERFSADPWIVLLTLEHPQMNGGNPVRLARNPTQDIISNGETFSQSWFNITLPSDNGEPARSQLGIQNVDGAIGRGLEQLTGPIECAIRPVLASDPDEYGKQFLKFKLRNVSWDQFYATGEISQATIMNNRWPKFQVTPKYFRHLFA